MQNMESLVNKTEMDVLNIVENDKDDEASIKGKIFQSYFYFVLIVL
jgi:hypothetical protein